MANGRTHAEVVEARLKEYEGVPSKALIERVARAWDAAELSQP